MMWLFVLLLSPTVLIAKESSPPIVRTQLGLVKGSILTSRLNKTIYSFRGIRYAEPPVGELRFQPPVPVKSWNGIYDATEDAPACPQPRLEVTSEDCLFLNVYTLVPPYNKEELLQAKKPVFLYIHGGGYYSASSNSSWAGPEYIIDQDVVFVTINYRLGSLGFISTGDKFAPGNLGLKDQVAALRWVQSNIQQFGGDPNSVTLYGYSVGGSSISLHLLSPMSRGLFHKAIVASGSNYGNWPVPKHQFELAQKQARLVGCPDDTSEKIMACLKNVSAKALGDSLDGFDEFGGEPIIIWLAVMEPDFGQERFLAEHPVDMIKAGKLANVPVITGVTKDEFAANAFYLLRNNTLVEELNANSEKYFPICFIYERDTPRSRNITKELKRFSFGNRRIDNNTYEPLAHLFEDGVIGYAVNIGAKLIAQYGKSPVYYYRFSYQGRYSHATSPESNFTIPLGVAHHDDLLYTLGIKYYPFFDETYPESKMVDTLTSLYGRFARNGNPNPEHTEIWKQFNPDTNYYLDIGEKLELKQNLYKDRYDEWARLFAQ